MTETVDIAVAVDTREAKAAFGEMEVSAKGLASALGSAFTGLAVQGKDLGAVIEQLGTRLSGIALTAALKPLENGLSALLSGAAGSLGGGLAFARGGVIADGAVLPFAKGGVLAGGGAPHAGEPFAGARVRPFARGGVVAAPTYFPLGGAGFGLMGEKGAEAILPLTRGADGSLGVRQAEGGARAQVTVNVATPDLSAFRRSDAYLSGLVARAVARAQRGA
ncbi:phage tail tape measure protein [Xanthobacter sp. V0B-10]|uniref:phage tail tape measure protein n=1 Tax=Xanthobacter albus TaxID=3119929 RepID=UPI003729A4FE